MATTLEEVKFTQSGAGSHFKLKLAYDLSQNVSNNTSTITYYLYMISTDGYSRSGNLAVGYINGSQVGGFSSIGVDQTKLIGTRTIIVTHNVDGTLSVNYSAMIDTPTSWSIGDCSVSGTLTLPTIIRNATITSAPNFNDTENPTITYSNPLGDNVSSLQAGIISTDGNTTYVSYRDIDKNGSSYTFTLTNEERQTLQNATPNSNTLNLNFCVKTVIDNTTFLDTVTKTLTIINADPIGTWVGFAETNNTIINLLGSSSASTIIQNASAITVGVNPTPQKGSTISYVSITNGNVGETIYTTPYQTLITPETDTFKITIKDSRGNTTEQPHTKTMIEYVPVDITSFSFKRYTPTSSNIILNAEIRYKQTTFGSTPNVPTIKWKKGESGTEHTLTSSDYTLDTQSDKITITDLTLSEQLVYTSSETFYLYVEDLLSSDTENRLVKKGVPTFEAGEYDFQVNGDLYVANTDRTNPVNIGKLAQKHIISAGLTSSISLTANGEKIATPNKIIEQVGDTTKLYLSTNGVYIGQGVNHVLVSGMLYVNIGTGTNNKIFNFYIYKNGLECLYNVNSGITTNNNMTKSIPPRLISVSAGDYFRMGFYGRNGDTINANDARTYITIEVID